MFGISYIANREAWPGGVEIRPITAAVGGWWSTLFYIIINNLIICGLIVSGNLFVRFRFITPGLLITAIQAVTIGWLAGSNDFEVPFETVTAANLQYFKIGIWETAAYALACAVTLPKSLLISETFPTKEWSQRCSLKDVKFSIDEIIIAVSGVILLISAAIIENLKIFG